MKHKPKEQRDELKRLEDLINTKKDADYTPFSTSELPTKFP